jgi:hypothetical protein
MEYPGMYTNHCQAAASLPCRKQCSLYQNSLMAMRGEVKKAFDMVVEVWCVMIIEHITG